MPRRPCARRPSGWNYVLLVGLVLTLTVAACGGAASPSPEPTATATAAPTATPSPTPVDVSAAFLRTITDPDFSAEATVSGTMAFGAIEGTLTGALEIAGEETSTTTTIAIAGAATTSERISVGETTYERTDDGPWIGSPREPTSLRTWLTTIESVEDLGVERQSGQDLHHLRPTGLEDLDPAALGIDTSELIDPTVGLDFYADDAGGLKVMVVEGAWTQEVAGEPTPVELTIQYDFRPWDGPVRIDPPGDVWERFTSESFAYSMAHPAGWRVESGETEDRYLVGEQAYVFVAPQDLEQALTLDQFVEAVAADYEEQFGGPPESIEETTLGGVPAKTLLMRFTNESDQDITLVDYLAVDADGTGWEVFLITLSGDGEAADLALFEQFRSTFEFVE